MYIHVHSIGMFSHLSNAETAAQWETGSMDSGSSRGCDVMHCWHQLLHLRIQRIPRWHGPWAESATICCLSSMPLQAWPVVDAVASCPPSCWETGASQENYNAGCTLGIQPSWMCSTNPINDKTTGKQNTESPHVAMNHEEMGYIRYIHILGDGHQSINS